MLAIVPARGGSKGLPRKNIRPLLGKPLIAYTIEEAVRSTVVTEVLVSTDDPEIERVALSYGASCPFLRPSALATDESPAIDTYLYTIRRLERERGAPIDAFIVLQPTSPLRIAWDIDETVALFLCRKADSAATFVAESHPVSWHTLLDEEQRVLSLGSATPRNRQFECITYFPNGAVYVFRTDVLESTQRYFTERSFAYLMPRTRSVDIDTIEDFEYAEYLLRRRHGQPSSS
jgi:CMP-N,N'-diacetyllegionaminic acid synthase